MQENLRGIYAWMQSEEYESAVGGYISKEYLLIYSLYFWFWKRNSFFLPSTFLSL